MRKLLNLSVLLIALIGVPMFLSLLQQVFPGLACGANSAGSLSSQIVHAPTSSASTILWAFSGRGSPAMLQTQAMAAFILSSSQKSGIDDTFALAVWAVETQDGRLAIAGTNNLGNITTPDPAAGVQIKPTLYIRRFATWQYGISAWFDQITTLYVRGGHATSMTTFALYYVQGLTPDEATSEQQQAAADYAHTLTSIMQTLQAHEASLHQSSGAVSGGGGSTNRQALSSLIPVSVPRGWATPEALADAASMSVTSACGANGSVGGNPGGGGGGGGGASPLVVTAMQYAAHLTADSAGFFDRWDSTTPAGAVNQQGVTWCTDFVATVVTATTGHAFSGYPDAQAWLSWSHPGLVAVAPTAGTWPLPGDVVILKTWVQGNLTASVGHVAIIVGVQPPTPGLNGSVVVVQGHSTHVLERWALLADGSVRPPWNEWTATLGYLRLPVTARGVASRVVPLLQWDPQAGYDSRAQHDRYWDSVCSAAAFTEIARAYGVPLRLGQVIDQLVGAGFLSASTGLSNDAAAWPWLARQYGMQAVVQWNRALSYDRLVQLAAAQGIPVVVGVRDAQQRFFPAFASGHFLVVVGGNASFLKIVDSSLYRITQLPRAEFDMLWTGLTVLLTPA
jgi:hypothetical protein